MIEKIIAKTKTAFVSLIVSLRLGQVVCLISEKAPRKNPGMIILPILDSIHPNLLSGNFGSLNRDSAGTIFPVRVFLIFFAFFTDLEVSVLRIRGPFASAIYIALPLNLKTYSKFESRRCVVNNIFF
jgi:hypothetical protein